MRGAGIGIRVIFLMGLSDDVREEAALEAGAIDFIDKSRWVSILLRRLQLIAEGTLSRIGSSAARLGQLELRFDINLALWAGRTVDLSLTEFKIVTR